MKYSELVGKNYFVLRESFSRELVYYVDYYVSEKKLQSAKVLANYGIHFKLKEGLHYGQFVLVGIWIKKSDHDKLEKAMEELERIAPLFTQGYKEARIRILDEIVVLKATIETN